MLVEAARRNRLAVWLVCALLARCSLSTSDAQQDSLSGKLYRQSWLHDQDEPDSMADNEIVTGPQHQRLPQPPHKRPMFGGPGYACGRAVATSKSSNKYNDMMLLRDQHNQLGSGGGAGSSSQRTAPKYRPFEIRTPRIIGGDETSPGEFPWTVSVKLNGQPICGGSLIERSWILTAAHCVVGYNPKNLTVRLGAYRIKDMNEQQSLDASISLFVVHQQYSMPRPFSNDIALLKVAEPIEFSDFIIPICLPTEDQVSTSLTSEIVNDYSRPLMAHSPAGDSLEAELETLGIVVSTQMSDKEIAKRFKRLEQNYLSSIGLGSAPVQSAAVPPLDQQLPPVLSAAAPAAAPQQEPSSQESHLLQGPPQGALYSSQTGGSSRPELKRPNSLKVHLLDPRPVNSAEQHFETAYGGSGRPKLQQQHGHNEVAWIRAARATYAKLADGFAAASESLEPRGARPTGDAQHEPPIKLTSLPISKELLREIQSVGSMQSLSLGLHQSDIVAMANDLEPAGNAADRERVISSSLGSGLRQLVRTSSMGGGSDELSSNTIDDPTKYSGMSGIVVGWGWVRENDYEEQQQQVGRGYQSVTLQKVRLPILRNRDCEAWFRSQEKKITLLQSQFCAGFNLGGKDACRGDSGGPMIIEDNSDTGRYKLVGIVSAGIGCARPSLPGLYTRVASFIPWINAQVAHF